MGNPSSTGFIFQIVFLVLVLHLGKVPVQSVRVEDDLTMTYSEGLILDKFKERMEPRLTEDYMHDDMYLVRWLRATNFSIDAAEQMLQNNIKWRKEQHISTIDNEDWGYFEDEFPYSIDTLDKQNRPIITIDSSKWDVRRAVVGGRRDALMRWMVKMMEDATKKVRQLQEDDKNVTRWGIIYNLGYFNLVQSGCIQCLPVYAAFISNYEKYYPNTMDSVILVNTPFTFEVVLQFIRPLMATSTKNMMKVFGTNKTQWQAELLKIIPKNQLPVEYGGSRFRTDFD